MATPYFPTRYFAVEAAGGAADFPDVGNVLETDTVDGVPGTYHEATEAEVAFGVHFGALSARTGAFGQTVIPADITGILETRIYSLLASNPTIKQRINTRIYPVVMPQDVTLPAISYQRIASGPENTMTGFSGLKQSNVIINAWARTYDEAKQIAAEIHAAMETATEFDNVLINEMDGFDQDVNLYVVSHDYSCWNQET
jgi:hypothetical protein